MDNEFAVPARPVLRLGKLAHSTLVPRSGGKVLAATSHAIYLWADNQELLWLADESSPLHRRCIQAVGPFPPAMADSRYAVVGRRLELGRRFMYDLARTSIWSPPDDHPGDRDLLAGVPARVVSGISWLTRQCAPVGFGTLLPMILELHGRRLEPCPRVEVSLAATRAWPTICRIHDFWLTGNDPEVLAAAEALIGLGEGLTPSGDDFVGGLLYARLRLRKICAARSREDHPDLDQVLRSSRQRTHVISYTLLADHARGHASEPLQRLVDAVLTLQDHECIGRRAAGLAQVGHSTGWDLLTGVLVAILATCCQPALCQDSKPRAAHLLQA
jgi:hypothetical protein